MECVCVCVGGGGGGGGGGEASDVAVTDCSQPKTMTAVYSQPKRMKDAVSHDTDGCTDPQGCEHTTLSRSLHLAWYLCPQCGLSSVTTTWQSWVQG